MPSSYLFSYGTLQPSKAPPEVRPLVRRLVPIGAATTRGELYDVGSYPGATFGPDVPSVVHGRVYRLPDRETLSKLDVYEEATPDAGRLFVRRRVVARLSDGRRVRCWAYEYNRPTDTMRRLTSGRFVRRAGGTTGAPKAA